MHEQDTNLTRREFLASSCALLALNGAGAAHSALVWGDDKQRQRFWTWSSPPAAVAAAAAAAGVTAVHRINVQGLDPVDAANLLCNRILFAEASDDPIAVVLQGFGMATPDPSAPAWRRGGKTPLFNCAADGVTNSACLEWWATCWFTSGVAQSRDWMRKFSEQVIQRQKADDRIRPPSRYLFDSEGWPEVVRSPCGVVDAFTSMRNDPRWSREGILGFGVPLSELYEQASAPPVKKGVPWWHPDQRGWSCWFQGILYQSADAAMKLAAFDVVTEFWPAVVSSNYCSSTSFDGESGRWDRIDGHPWMKFRHRSSSRSLSPALYVPADVDPAADPATVASACLAKAEEQLRGALDSYGGTPGRQILPWLQIPGDRAIEGKPLPKTSEDLLRGLIEKSAARGVAEFVLWGNDDAWTLENWRSLVRACSKG